MFSNQIEMKRMKGLLLLLICLITIPVIATANFDLIDCDNTYDYLKNFESASSWWEKANNDTTGMEMTRLWYSVYLDIKAYDPTFFVIESDKPLAIICIDKTMNDLHVYAKNIYDMYSHIQLFRVFESSREMIYEKTSMPLEKVKERISKLADVQYELTYDTYLKLTEGDQP